MFDISRIDTSAEILADVTLKATVLLFAACLMALLFRRSSAAFKHRLWSLTLLGVLLLPLLSWTLPAWPLAVLPGDTQSTPLPTPSVASAPMEIAEPRRDDVSIAASTNIEPRPQSINATEPARSVVDTSSFEFSPSQWLVAAWMLGGFISLAFLARGWWRARAMIRRSRIITDEPWQQLLQTLQRRLGLRRHIELREGTDAIVPLTWGIVRPVVLIPSTSAAWSDALKQSVLLHELLHIQRGDIAYQLAGRLACVVYWFHPLAWFAMHRLRHDREQACDDAVVDTGEKASDYAGHLLEIARQYRYPHGLTLAIEMARPGKLEQRLQAMFDERRSHQPLRRRLGLLLCLLIIGMTTGVAVLSPATSMEAIRADEPSASVDRNSGTSEEESEKTHQGTVVTSDGQPIPEIEVRVFRADGRKLPSFITDESGTFEVPASWWETPRFAGDSYVLVTGDRERGIGWMFINTIRKRIRDGVIVPFMPSPFTMKLLPFNKNILGRVVDREERPIAGIRVQLTRLRHPENYVASIHDYYPDNEPAFPAVVTGDDGQFSLPIPAETEISLEFVHPEWVQLSAQFRRDDRRDAGNITLIRAAHVAGNVINQQTGEGIAGVTVAASTGQDRRRVQNQLPAKPEGEDAPDVFVDTGNSAVTDDAGRYRIDGLVPGEIRLSVNNSRGEAYRKYVTARPEPFDVMADETIQRTIELQVGRHLQGRVQFAGSNEPLVDVNVSVSVYRNADRRQLAMSQSARTNERGEFDCYVLPGYAVVSVNEQDQYGERYDGSKVEIMIPDSSDVAPVKLTLIKPDPGLIQPTLKKRLWVKGQVHAIAFMSDSGRLVTAGSLTRPMPTVDLRNPPPRKSRRGELKIWDVEKGEVIADFPQEFGALTDVAVSPDDRTLITVGGALNASDDGVVRTWDVETTQPLLMLTGHTDRIYSVVCSPDGKLIASGSEDHTTRIWNLKTGEAVTVLHHDSSPRHLRFSRDGKMLFTGFYNSAVVVWNTTTWNEIKSLNLEVMYLWAFEVPPNASQLYAAGSPLDGKRIGRSWMLTVWDTESGKLKWSKNGDESWLTDISLSPDGGFIAGSQFNPMIWHAQTGKEIGIIGNQSGATSEDRILFSPDGKIIALARLNDVSLWDVRELYEKSAR